MASHQLVLKGERVSMRDLAYRALRDACIRGLLAPGEMLVEEQLAASLRASRTPLREALQRLRAEGLVERADNGRMFVRAASEEEARHLYAVRAALERLAVREAAEHITPAALERLEAALSRMRQMVAADENAAESGGTFHDILYELAGNPINKSQLQRLQALIDRYRHISAGSTALRQHEAVREHEAILAALRRGDAGAADDAMRVHVAHSLISVLATFPKG